MSSKAERYRAPPICPVSAVKVRLELSVRRLYCRNPACLRRIFVERLPGLITPRAQHTDRLAAAQGRVGVAMGGEAGARMLQQIGMLTSGDTVLRLVRRLPLPRRPMSSVLGVDDWARCKGQTYGTILVDLERHRVVELLADQSAPTLAGLVSAPPWDPGRCLRPLGRVCPWHRARGAAGHAGCG